jgi:hypothetical protein
MIERQRWIPCVRSAEALLQYLEYVAHALGRCFLLLEPIALSVEIKLQVLMLLAQLRAAAE